MFPRVVRIDIPALDRYLDWLERQEGGERAHLQAQIDALTKRVQDFTAAEKAALKAVE